MPALPDVVFDPAAVAPELVPLRAALSRRDWTAARAVLDSVGPAARSALIRLCGEEHGVEPFLQYVLSRDPDDTTAAAMLGAHYIDKGWKLRSSYQAEHVSDEQLARFHECLRQAEQVLIDAAARNPGDCAVWVLRLPTARGLQLGLSEARRRYDRLALYDPHHLPGQSHLLQSLCPKWGGTFEQVHAFARERMLAAQPGTHNARLVADAHLERWLDLDHGEAGRQYLMSEPVRAELYEAAHRSVWHPAFRRTTGWVSVMNSFAMLFSLMGDDAAAAGLFVALGGLSTEHPWDYLGDPANEVRTRRARALAKGGRR